MEKLHSKPVKGRQSRKEMDNMMAFGDPDQTMREEEVWPERPS